jgi:hypothetical protein
MGGITINERERSYERSYEWSRQKYLKWSGEWSRQKYLKWSGEWSGETLLHFVQCRIGLSQYWNTI